MMDDLKLEAVIQHLDEELPGCDILETHTLDADVISFRIAHKRASLLLNITDEFLEDNDSERITELLRQSDVTNMLLQHPDLGLLVSSDGATYFQRPHGKKCE